MKSIIGSVAFVLGLSLAQAACSVDTNDASGGAPLPPATPSDPMAPAPEPRAGKAVVRVVHASADAPSVDVYVKGSDKPVVTGLAYGQTSTWLELDPGTYVFELRAAGAKPTDPIAYRTGELAIPAGAKISAIAAGLLGAAGADDAFRVLPIVEGFGAAAVGSARVRVIHAGADAPTVGLDIGNDDPASPETASLARFADTGAEGAALPAGKKLGIGVVAGGARVTAFTTPELPEGANVLVVATGLLGKLARERDGFALLAVGPNGSLGFVKQDPIVYALHGSPDAPRVDAFVGAAEVVDDLGFGELASPVQVPPGTYELDFYPHAAGSTRPTGAAAAKGSTGALAAGERYLTIATGFLGSPTNGFRLASFRDGFALGSGKAQLRAVHASPDAPEVDLGLAGPSKIDPVLFSGLAFGQASADEGLGAAPGHLVVGVTPAGQNGSIVARLTVPVTADQRAFVVAGGSLGNHGQGFRFLVVDTAPSPWTVTTALPH